MLKGGGHIHRKACKFLLGLVPNSSENLSHDSFFGWLWKVHGIIYWDFQHPQDAIVEVTRDPQKAMTGPAEGQPKTYPWEVVGVRAPFKAWELAEGEETRQMFPGKS